MRAAALLAWGDLDERRRRRSRGLLGRVPAAVWSLAVGVGMAVWLFDAAGALSSGWPLELDPAAVRRVMRVWLAVVIAGSSLTVFGAPFRMYWRRDSAMLARLAIRGEVLFKVALVRSLRAATAWLAAPAVVAIALGPLISWEIALRHLALVGVGWCGGALLGPALALAAGAMIASDKIEGLMKQMGGEFEAPKTGWLGILPGLGATGVVLAIIGSADWALGAPTTALGSPLAILVPPVLVSGLAIAWALARADGAMLAAVREVAALDQERLAHIELTRLSPLESGVARLLGRRARLLFDKDARLARRRYPLPYFLSMVGTVTLWGLAIARPESLLTWATVVTACLGAYAVVMARRRALAPIEHPRFLATLPLTAGDVASGKRAASLLWIGVYLGVGIAPVIARAPSPLTTGIALGAIAAVSVIAALFAPNT